MADSEAKPSHNHASAAAADADDPESDTETEIHFIQDEKRALISENEGPPSSQ